MSTLLAAKTISHDLVNSPLLRATGHWYVLLAAVLMEVRAVFSLVDVNNKGFRVVLWILVLLVAVTLMWVSMTFMSIATATK